MTAARLFAPSVLLDHRGAHRDHGLVVDDGVIVGGGPVAELRTRHPQAGVEDLRGHALLPGTVNAHSHSFQSLLRGLGDDQPFHGWREALYRVATRFDAEAVHVAALHAFAEMLRNGITTVVDFFYLHHRGNERALAVADAARALGIRLVIARSMLDAPAAPAAFREAVAVANATALAARPQGDRLASVVPAPHSPHGASEEMMRAGAELAREWGTVWHTHLSESRREPLAAVDERVRVPPRPRGAVAVRGSPPAHAGRLH